FLLRRIWTREVNINHLFLRGYGETTQDIVIPRQLTIFLGTKRRRSKRSRSLPRFCVQLRIDQSGTAQDFNMQLDRLQRLSKLCASQQGQIR
ncbi:hypothetical protein ACWJKQ_20310, partial [Xanthomonas axonopodis pv. cassiae]